MSKISLKANESGTGTFEIQAPATNTHRVLELPDEAGKVLTDVSDIEPQVKTATNAGGAAPIFACRAWVNFNGTGTVAIRASGNVSSVTRNRTGDYTVNFATAMPDVNYAAIAGPDNSAGRMNLVATPVSSSQVELQAKGTDDLNFRDLVHAQLAVFR